MNKSYTELLNKDYGENCFILAAGPSLYEISKNSFFPKLKKYGTVICVNSSIIAFNEPDYWISTDALTLRWSWYNLVRKSKSIKIVRSSWLNKHKDEIEGFYVFNPRNTPEDEIDFEDTGLMYCNSTNAAIDFGIKCGVKKIFIMGLDHNLIDSKHHFWQFLPLREWPIQNKPAQGGWSTQRKVFPIHLQSYKALKKFAEYKNCEIFNCNIESNVKVFKKIRFEEIEKII